MLQANSNSMQISCTLQMPLAHTIFWNEVPRNTHIFSKIFSTNNYIIAIIANHLSYESKL